MLGIEAGFYRIIEDLGHRLVRREFQSLKQRLIAYVGRQLFGNRKLPFWNREDIRKPRERVTRVAEHGLRLSRTFGAQRQKEKIRVAVIDRSPMN